jgi:molybdopterin-containing oxidoreductase family iron-sulfur binding subunit
MSDVQGTTADANAVAAGARPALEAIRAKLDGASGRAYWRSLEELVESPEVQRELALSYPSQEALWRDPVGRRSFLQLMGASLSLAGLGACTRQPAEDILPYASRPESILPGKPRYFATAFPFGAASQGLLVESHMGRPTKIEGNPEHPSNLGATDAIAQAQVLGLYDPDRSQTVLQSGRIGTWAAFLTALKGELDVQRRAGGRGLRVLSRTIDSPSLAAQREELLEDFPAAAWHQYEPVNRDRERAGAQLAFGFDVACRYDFAKADIIVSLDADFLVQGPGAVAGARAFADGRRARKGMASMNRLYAVEAAPGITGAAADHRLAVRHSDVAAVALALANEVSVSALGELPKDFAHGDWVHAVAADLEAYPRRSLVLAGAHQPAEVHALAHAMNAALGNVGSTVTYTQPIEPVPIDQGESLRDLVRDMSADRVQVLVVLGSNPVYETPADLAFGEAFDRVPFRVHLGLYEDETAVQCHWHVPETHFLESWSDTRGHDGTVSIVQPLIAPLYAGRSAHELLAAMLERGRSSHDVVRAHWQSSAVFADDFEVSWRRALHDGVVAGTRLSAVDARLAPELTMRLPELPGSADGGLELQLRPDPHVWDGRFANNGWLQELPKPTTRLTWDNALLLSPRTAEEHGLDDGRLVRVGAGDDTLEVPVWIVPGHAEGALTLHLGYGKKRGGRLCVNAGRNAYRVQSSLSPFARAGVTLEKRPERVTLACTQDHHGMEGGHTGASIQHRAADILRIEEFDRFRRGELAHGDGHGAGHGAVSGDHGAADGHGGRQTLLDGKDHVWDGHAWGMVIDLSACIGCSACTIACQAENNIPVVGREEVARGREMHWIRIDRYFVGHPENPRTLVQPVPCMHCEHAPCEVVCPVGATVHSKEGLNDMVYNRCVGTRYCSNNCPYKVRRFNFFQYADYDTESLKLLNNPDVTVRFRGVMEKCTYCVQRINAARIDAKKSGPSGERIADGGVVTACQQVCPTRAIAFGDINDPTSEVAALREEPHEYGMLDKELNTIPRTTYLARLTNENPRLGDASGTAQESH